MKASWGVSQNSDPDRRKNTLGRKSIDKPKLQQGSRWTRSRVPSHCLAACRREQSPIETLEPTGKRFQHEGIRIFRIVDGKLVETWGGADTLSQLQQLGVLHALVAQHDEARK